MTTHDDPTLDPRALIDEFCQLYGMVHGRLPNLYYMGFGWYTLNNEVVHRRLLMEEVVRMYDILRRQQFQKHKKNFVQRIIDKLRHL